MSIIRSTEDIEIFNKMLIKQHVTEAINAISKMCPWSTSPQGYKYWKRVVDNLQKLEDYNEST